MSDVDAIRRMASEHDLEFVDLDAYGVDPAAGEILSASLAREHHVVAIKRKFGTPVIATADPDDLSAQDTVRASIGRDFISVVAAPEQIGDYLDQLFGPEGDAAEQVGDAGASQPADDADFEAEAEPQEGSVLVDADGRPGGDPFGDLLADELEENLAVLEAAESAVGDVDPARSEVAIDDAVDDADPAQFDIAIDDAVDDSAVGDDAVPTKTKSTRRRARDREARRTARSALEISPVPFEGDDWQEFSKESQVTEDGVAVEALEAQALDVEADAAEAASPDRADGVEPVADETEERHDDSAGATSPVDEVIFEDLAPPPPPPPSDQMFGSSLGDGIPALEPATSVLPMFGSGPDTLEPPAVANDDLVAGVDELEQLARTVHGSVDDPGAYSTVLAADLVAEAVASYQEQHGEVQDFDPNGSEASSATAHFPPLAKALVEGDRVSLTDMGAVLEEHRESRQSIARILTAQNLVTEADLMWGMAQEMGLEFVDLDTSGVDYVEAGMIPEATARHHNVLVIGNEDGVPVVAASNPTDVFAMDDLRTIMGRSFTVVVATRTQITAYIGRAFNSGTDAADMAMEASLEMDGSGSESGIDDIQAVTEEAPIVRYVNLLILQALNERASDVHVEPTGTDLRIRYRIDGVLHDVSTAPRAIAPAVTTRLKVMADMNVAEHRIPQDGRISLNVGSKGIDLRMATLPTIHGEKVVMRVLDKSSVVLGFADLGFDEDLWKTYEGIYTKPYGTILVTGPTGSGKSTTLYTTLTALNSPEKNIITVEDPVELQLKGVNQVQLNIKAGLTFASALKSILRSDPDIVLVGEIRDKETAVIAIEAALTGHMVLATLHTNNAASTPMRLIEMGLEPFLVTSSLSGVLAQRLARRLCMHCKQPYQPSEADIAAAGWTPDEVDAEGEIPQVYRAVGCSACANTGYRGRKALAELMPMSEEIERMIIEGGSVDDIHRIAVAQGMTTLRQSGLRKAIEGETTLEEVLRVVA